MEPQPARARWSGGIPVPIQRSILFIAGLVLLTHEAIIRTADPRWPLLVIYAGMMGLPLALKADDLRKLLPTEETPE